jgi:hypothetical protein
MSIAAGDDSEKDYSVKNPRGKVELRKKMRARNGRSSTNRVVGQTHEECTFTSRSAR